MNTEFEKQKARIERQKKMRLKRWAKLPKSQTDNHCWFRAWVKEKFGEASCCSIQNTAYENCGLQCAWIAHVCAYCGSSLLKHVLQEWQDTSGAMLVQWVAVCANPKCPLNNPQDAPEKLYL